MEFAIATTLLVACRQESTTRDICTHICDSDPAIAARPTTFARVLVDAAALHPDVLMVEYVPELKHQLCALPRRLGRNDLAVRTVVLSESRPRDVVIEFIRRGASGWLAMSSDYAAQAKAVRAIHDGETWFTRTELVCAIVSELRAAPPTANGASGNEAPLTAREYEILMLIGTGRTNKEIGRELSISDQTVKTHLHNIYVKLHRSGRYKALLLHGRQQGAGSTAGSATA